MPTTHALQIPPAGHESLGELVLSMLDAQAAAGGPPSAAGLVEGLAEAVPGFDDTGLYKGQQVRMRAGAHAGWLSRAQPTCRVATACSLAAADPPALASHSQPQPRQVCFYRKAQLLAAQLHLRFRGEDARFRFADMAALSVDSGGCLPPPAADQPLMCRASAPAGRAARQPLLLL